MALRYIGHATRIKIPEHIMPKKTRRQELIEQGVIVEKPDIVPVLIASDRIQTTAPESRFEQLQRLLSKLRSSC